MQQEENRWSNKHISCLYRMLQLNFLRSNQLDLNGCNWNLLGIRVRYGSFVSLIYKHENGTLFKIYGVQRMVLPLW
jgi:hypothetical protein